MNQWEEFWKFAYNKWPEHFNGFDWEFDNWLINPARFCELRGKGNEDIN